MNVSRLKIALSNIHRIRRTIDSYEWWNCLNHLQKIEVNSLYEAGYKINFVRQAKQTSIVVMSHRGNQVIVNQDGLVDTNPDIKMRQ